MKTLLYKQLRLVCHPMTPVFCLFGFMVIIPNYPYTVIFFYVMLGLFFTFLNMREQKGNPRLTLLVGCLAIVILAGCVAKFGVIDQYRRLDAAQAAYASVHTEYTQMQELLKGYDRLLMEYRTYSMEWATDGSEDNGTLVDRQKALDLLEQEMLSRGRLVSLQVSGNKMVVAMSGMSLDQISRMFDVIQQSPIVSNVELNLASTEDGNVSTILDFTVRITLRSAEEADK